MISLFENNEQWAVFKEELLSWMGTPYRHLQGAKHYGADCTLFIANAMVNIGLMKKLEYEYYPRDWHQHTQQEFVLEGLYRHTFKDNMKAGTDVIQLPVDVDLQRGDLLHFATTPQNISNHCSVVLDEFDGRCHMTIHSIERRGVSRFPLGRTWKRKMRGVFRFVEK